jgi:hypothetical protein
MVWHDILILQWCKSNIHSRETILWIFLKLVIHCYSLLTICKDRQPQISQSCCYPDKLQRSIFTVQKFVTTFSKWSNFVSKIISQELGMWLSCRALTYQFNPQYHKKRRKVSTKKPRLTLYNSKCDTLKIHNYHYHQCCNLAKKCLIWIQSERNRKIVHVGSSIKQMAQTLQKVGAIKYTTKVRGVSD